MPKENYTISAFHGGLNSSSDPRDIRNEDLSVASGVDVSNVGRVSIMNGEVHHFASSAGGGGNRVAAFSEIYPGYGLFSFKTDALGTSSQSNNYIRTEQIQYGSAGSVSVGSVTFIMTDLTGHDSVTYKLMFHNSSVDSSTAQAVSIDGTYYIPISENTTASTGTDVNMLAENLSTSIQDFDNLDIGVEFTAIRIGNKVKVSSTTNTIDANGILVLYETANIGSGSIGNIDYDIDNMVGGLAAQHQKTRFIFPSTTVTAITYYIGLALDRYTLTGHADDKPFHLLSRFIHANGTSTTTSDATHPVYSNGTLLASASQNALKKHGSTDTDGIDGNSDYSAYFEVEPNNSDSVSLLKNYDFGDGSNDWTSSQFSFGGAPSSPIATFSDSSDGYLKQTGFTIEANTLYQLTFTVGVAALSLTIKDENGTSLIYAAGASYAVGTHTIWFYQTANRDGIYIAASASGSAGAGTLTDIKLQRVLPSFIVESATNTNFLAESGIEQSEGYIGNRWITICDRNSNVHMYSSTGNSWNTPISLGSGSNAKGVFYFVDGALRICDANISETSEGTSFNSSNTPKWYGYIDRYFYGTSSAGYTNGGSSARNDFYINRFVSTNVALTALDVIATAKHSSTPTATTSSKPVNLKFTEASEAGSTWAVGATTTYEIAVTTLYDDSKQESALDIPDSGPTVDIQDAYKLKVLIALFAEASANGLHQKHPRVSGFHIYMREEGKTDWFLQWEVDIKKGIRAYKTGDYSAWQTASTGTTQAYCESAYLLDPRQIETYEIMTSRDQSYNNVSLDTAGNCWRSAVIANRRAWIAAPTMQDELGNTITKGDTMIKSNVNQFDTFTLDNRVDVAIRDGEDIVAITEFGDRILQFKQQTLYIINISQDFEFLEGTYKNRGILNHNAQCRTDYGVAWVNKSGCYMYDGKQVLNLLERNGIDLIDTDTWSEFINKNSIIGYSPKKKQLIVLNNTIVSPNDNTPNSVFVYELVLGSWTKGYQKWTNKNKTNFLIDWEDGLMIAHNPVGIIKSWSSTNEEYSYELVTKDIDFGKPAIRKKFYKVYITYKCSSATTNVRVQYYIDGKDTAYNFKPIENATLDGDYSTLDGSKTEWTTAELRPSSSTQANNIYSIRIRLYNPSAGLAVPSDFQINDISLIHRRKPIK